MATRVERRRFFQLVGSAGVLAGLPVVFPDMFGARVATASEGQPGAGGEVAVYPRLPEVLNWQRLTPNSDINLVNAVVVPEVLMTRTNNERVKMAVDFTATYDVYNSSHLKSDLWEYGESVRDALKRGQEVSLVLDIPDNLGFPVDRLGKYFRAVFQRFKCGESQRANFYIGNELNAYPITRTDEYLKFYARVIVAAAVVKREVAPEAKLFPYPEAYYGNGMVLEKSLRFITEEIGKYNLANPLSGLRMVEVVAGLPFHYYDRLTGIRERASMYKAIAHKHGVPPVLRLMELGKPEGVAGEKMTVDEHQDVIVRNLAEAAVLVKEGVLECAFWHTAESVGDPGGHALFVHEGNRFTAKPQYETYSRMSKLLFSGAEWEERELGNFNSQVLVRSQTSLGEEVNTTWVRRFDPEGGLVAESRPEITIKPKIDRRDFLKYFVGQN